jgi:tRNA threonylcarbamoyladenosine biosynthesis protein TsaE
VPTVTEFIARTPEETEALGRRWADEFRPGWLIGLSGDLGAGKTQLARGLARGFSFAGRVSSPTYGLINEYNGGRWPVFHLDLYRLDTPEQIIGAGLEPYLIRPEGVTIVEWIERWWPWAASLNPPLGERFTNPIRLVRIEAPNETDRRICHVDLGL